MREKRFLLMFDHVSMAQKETFSIIHYLIDSSPSNRRYTFICSTRSHTLCDAFQLAVAVQVSLQDPTGDVSRDILCAHAGFKRIDFDMNCNQNGSAIWSVLHKCSGLALALAVAGGAVKRLLDATKPENVKGVIWNHYQAYLCNSFDQFGQISGLFASLSSVVSGINPDRQWRCPLGVWEVFCSLSAVRENMWMPYSIIQRLWGIKKRDDVISVVRPLSVACLATRDRRGVQVGILVPDIVLDYSRFEAQRREWTRKAHMRLLTSYANELHTLSSSPPAGAAGTKEEVLYLKDHIQHHVLMATDKAERAELEFNSHIADQALRVVQQYYFQMPPDPPSSLTTAPESPRPDVPSDTP